MLNRRTRYNASMREKICVVGLGYVGLPLAVAFARRFAVVACDRDSARVAELRNGRDSTGEVSEDELRGASNLSFVDDIADARACNVFVVAVPTPLTSDRKPDLSLLEGACRGVGGVLKRGDLVVIESTVYPGATEEVCAPILAEVSGLRFNADFACGYSPERLRPGTAHRHIADIVKITSGTTPAAAARTDALYKTIIRAGTFAAESVRAAEAAKVLENIQRDVNIALMNEAAMICDSLGLDSRAVFAAAATKWDFLNFQPGLVGGHCIGIDPHYLAHKAAACGRPADLILSARRVNDSVGAHVAARTLSLLAGKGLRAEGARVLVLGFAFKENCADPRESRVFDIVRDLRAAGCEVAVCDPVADGEKTRAEYGLELERDVGSALSRGADAVVFAVAHDAFRGITESQLGDALVADVKGTAPRWDWRL